MACLCGDIQCPSCGPAQGNFRCFCGEWFDNGCEHLDEDGTVKPEFEAEAAAYAERERLSEEQLVKDLEDEARMARHYWEAEEIEARRKP